MLVCLLVVFRLIAAAFLCQFAADQVRIIERRHVFKIGLHHVDSRDDCCQEAARGKRRRNEEKETVQKTEKSSQVTYQHRNVVFRSYVVAFVFVLAQEKADILTIFDSLRRPILQKSLYVGFLDKFDFIFCEFKKIPVALIYFHF